MRVGIRKESRITIAHFQSSLRYEIRDRMKLLPYNNLNDLMQIYTKVEQ